MTVQAADGMPERSTYRRLENAAAALLLAAIVLLVGLASVARAFGQPIIWSVEIAQRLFVWLCMLAADIALHQNRHFGLTILLDRLPPAATRLMALLNQVIVAALLAFLLFYAFRNAVLMHPRLIGATQMNASFIHASMVLGLVLMLGTLAGQIRDQLLARDDA
jgi:TRAP-type C4-dicarboxylate transport system permease small subunit